MARQRRDHKLEGIRCARAMGRGVGERINDLELLDDRTGPPMRDDQRQRVLVLGPDVNEMDVEPANLGNEVRQAIQLRLALAPVVVRPPILRLLPDHLQRNALRMVSHRLALGPPGRSNAPAPVVDRPVRKTNLQRANRDGA